LKTNLVFKNLPYIPLKPFMALNCIKNSWNALIPRLSAIQDVNYTLFIFVSIPRQPFINKAFKPNKLIKKKNKNFVGS